MQEAWKMRKRANETRIKQRRMTKNNVCVHIAAKMKYKRRYDFARGAFLLR